MASWLAKMFSCALGPFETEFLDPVLDTLRFDEENHGWVVTVSGLTLSLSGNPRPDESVLAHARRIASDVEGFRGRLSAFLGVQAVEYARDYIEAGEMVRTLRIDQVVLFPLKRGCLGMVHFVEIEKLGWLWHCDMTETGFECLVFDS